MKLTASLTLAAGLGLALASSAHAQSAVPVAQTQFVRVLPFAEPEVTTGRSVAIPQRAPTRNAAPVGDQAGAFAFGG